jgi:hypothetical protein
LDYTTNQRSIPFGYLLHLLVQGHQSPLLCFSGVFIAEVFDGVGDKGSGDTTKVNVETPLEAFLEDFHTSDYFPQLLQYQEFQSISIWVKGILL